MSRLNVIILAAGLGSRLPATLRERPKCLLAPGGKTLLDRTLNHFSKLDIPLSVTVVSGYADEIVKRHLENVRPLYRFPISVAHNPDYQTTNNAVSLSLALDDGPFLLMDGDLVYDFEILQKLVSQAGKNGAVMDGNLARLNAEAMKGKLEDGRLRYFSKTLSPADSCGEYIGMLKLGEDWAAALKSKITTLTSEEKKTFYYEDAINGLMSGLSSIPPVWVETSFWNEIDTAEDFAHAEEALSRERVD